MDERFIDKAQRLFGAECDPEVFLNFLDEFCDQQWWLLTQEQTDASGKTMIGFSFVELESSELPALMALAHQEDQTHYPMLQATAENESLREVPGVFFVSMAQQQRFHLILADGEDQFVLEHQQLLTIQRLLEMKNSPDKVTPPSAQQMVEAVPQECNDAIYAYCRTAPDIRNCWIGMMGTPGQTQSRPDYLVLLEGNNLDIHRGRIQEICQQHLPANQQLVLLDPLDTNTLLSDHIATLQKQAPYYSQKHSQSWLGQLKRFFNRPRVVWIQIELVPE